MSACLARHQRRPDIGRTSWIGCSAPHGLPCLRLQRSWTSSAAFYRGSRSVALGHPDHFPGLPSYADVVKVPPELRPWMWLVWSGGVGMLWLSSCCALSWSLDRDRKKAEDTARAFYSSEAAVQNPSASFISEYSRLSYQEFLNTHGRVQRIIQIRCYSALGGSPSECHAYVQREKSKSFETIIILGRKGVQFVVKDQNPTLKQAPPKRQPPPHVPSRG